MKLISIRVNQHSELLKRYNTHSCFPSLVDYSVFNQEKLEDEGDVSSIDETDQRLLMFSDNRQDAVTGSALWRQQFSTVAWLHMLNLQRERKPFIYK